MNLKDVIDKYKEYPCTGCGICCTRVNIGLLNLEKLSEYYDIPLIELIFPYSYDSNGTCQMLDDNKRCKVYENRPNVCNIEWLVKKGNLNRQEFFKENIKICNSLIDQEKLDKSYKIIL